MPKRSIYYKGRGQVLRMYLLDTNHCSRLIDGHPNIIKKFTQLGDAPIATCVIVQGELMFMVWKSERKAENLSNIKAFLNNIEVLPVNNVVADIYGKLKAAIIDRFGPKEKAKRRKAEIEKLGFKENDLWIAAVAKSNGFTIVSADNDFDRIKEVDDLRVESWLPPEKEEYDNNENNQ